ncbi:diguanylate cyclase/phosphodiesterase [Catenulispora acidiphila DSM 44928]|uniref:Diguanylate cyclase/phosphodiesterase n=1 Tax=Catenulispora acidiphila (strain DSM 44928 / JCM 14897 / NBRC 102108 / NRRL B-24433 / ID139908) TaxID=479433 RepID=C7Q7F0_CATAD|nr:EAL domain-containing protein [Catenulispora acidiphila]ACU70238.1 diguanylate cyclase/phosphodiesterase [Catenulispora acidiphila DSM 44928]
MHRPFEPDYGPKADPGRLYAFVASVGAAGVTLLAALLILNWRGSGPTTQSLPALLMTVCLVFLGELRPLMRLQHTNREAATTTVFTIALLMLAGWPLAAMVQAAASVVGGAAGRKTWWRTLFNVSQFTLSLGAACLVLRCFGVVPTPDRPWAPSVTYLAAILLAGVAYFVVNLFLVWQAVALWTGAPLRGIACREWRVELQVVGASVVLAPLITVVMRHEPYLIVLFIPVLLVFYRSALAFDESEWQSLHDPLTALPNRKALRRQAETMLGTDTVAGNDGRSSLYSTGRAPAAVAVPPGKIGLFLLDLDRFKEVNDTLGHAAGDELIREVAQRLSAAVRAEDMVARLGGDEFAVLLPGLPDVEAAQQLAQRLLDAVAVPYRLHGFKLDVEASLGIALHPDDARHYDVLLRHADVAMYEAKRSKKGYVRYDPAKDRNSPDRLGLLSDLREALDAGRIEVHYQPQASFQNDRVVGVEALARWRHEARGAIPPETFVKLAESSGLMARLTEYILDVSLRQAAQWWRSGYGVPLSVNVSLRDIESAGFVEMVARKLAQHRVRPEALRLEVAERVLVGDAQSVRATLIGLSKLGIRLSLDNFGTGYASLLTLRRLPFDEIKIDRSFVGGIGFDADDAAIVRSTIDLAHSLGLRVVAEGVEDSATWSTLDDYGCDEAQGWLVSKALPPGEICALLALRVPSAAPTSSGPASTPDQLSA